MTPSDSVSSSQTRVERQPRSLVFDQVRPLITNAALLAIGVGMMVLARQLISEYDHFTIGFSGVSGWSAILYIVACGIILTQPSNRWTLPLIITFAISCRLITLFPDPFLSSDVYRYAWDGVVQHAGISPYRYVPGDPVLKFLREPNQDLFDNINRRDYARTIYPPIAQMIFWAITWISPTVTFMKMAMVLFEGVTVWALLRLLRELGRPPQQILLYAWCPLLIWEVAGSGHLDSAGMAFIALALLNRIRRRPLLTGLFLGLAVMMKFYPIVLLPPLCWRDERGASWKVPAALAAVIIFGYACYSSVVMLVFGFAGGYVQEEGLQSGVRYFLFELLRRAPGFASLPTWGFFAFCAAIFAAISLWAWQTASFAQTRPSAFLAPAFAFAVALMLLFSPHYPWYVIWLIPFFTLQPNLAVLTYLMGIFYGFTTALADPGPKMFLLNEYLYAATAAASVLWLVARRWPLHRKLLLPTVVPTLRPDH